MADISAALDELRFELARLECICRDEEPHTSQGGQQQMRLHQEEELKQGIAKERR